MTGPENTTYKQRLRQSGMFALEEKIIIDTIYKQKASLREEKTTCNMERWIRWEVLYLNWITICKKEISQSTGIIQYKNRQVKAMVESTE